MIVRKLPSPSQRWKPPNKQNNAPQNQKRTNQNNAPQTGQSQSQSQSWKYKQNNQHSRNNTSTPNRVHRPKQNYVITSKNTKNTNSVQPKKDYKWKVSTANGFRYGQVSKPPQPSHTNNIDKHYQTNNTRKQSHHCNPKHTNIRKVNRKRKPSNAPLPAPHIPIANDTPQMNSTNCKRMLPELLHEIFSRDKHIKWTYQTSTNEYEPVFVILEHYGTNDQIIGRSVTGQYNLYNAPDIMESPPLETQSAMIKAVQQLLKGYQLRFESSSLGKQKLVQVTTKSKSGWVQSGAIQTHFTKVIGFETQSRVTLQDTSNGAIHSFPLQNIKESQTLNLETKESLFTHTSASNINSYAQYVSPSYWINGEQKGNTEKKQKTEKILKQIEIGRLKKETNNLQNGIVHKLKLIDKFDMSMHGASDKKGIAALSVLWTQIVQQNHRKSEEWKQIAMDNSHENALLKQQMSRLKNEEQINGYAKDEQIRVLQSQITELLQSSSRQSTEKSEIQSLILQQKLNEERMKHFECENAMLKKNSKLALNRSDQTNAEKVQRGGGFAINSTFLTMKEVLGEYQSLRDQEYHTLYCELKQSLKELKSKAWHKLYIAHTCHKYMFDMLQLCSKSVKKYIDALYQSVGEALCIDQVISNKCEKEEHLDYCFHFYLQQNHEILYCDFKSKHRGALVEKAKKIYNKQTQAHFTAEAYVLLKRYLDKCTQTCFIFLLQRPKVTLYPKEFKPMLKSVPFDATQHTKSMGSDRKSSFVLYYIWPTVKRGNEKLDMTIQVIVRDNDVPMNKKKR